MGFGERPHLRLGLSGQLVFASSRIEGFENRERKRSQPTLRFDGVGHGQFLRRDRLRQPGGGVDRA